MYSDCSNTVCGMFAPQDQDNDALKSVLQKNIGQTVKIVVYNSKARSSRGFW